MSLVPGEQRTLTEIERKLGKSDPGLAAMLVRFTTESTPNRGLLWRPPRRGPGKGNCARMFLLVATGLTLLMASIAIALVAVSHSGPPTRGHNPGPSPVSAYGPGL
jgi:hypothetical protein